MLNSKTPELKDNYQIQILLENQLQKEIIEKIYNQLLFFLKKELQNDKKNSKMIKSPWKQR